MSSYLGETIQIVVASEFLSSENPAFSEGIIYGNDYYSSNSDIVCIINHTGYFIIKDLPPTEHKGVIVELRVGKPRSIYNSVVKNDIVSGKLTGYTGHSLKPEGFEVLKDSLGDKLELTQMAMSMGKSMEVSKNKVFAEKTLDYDFTKGQELTFNLSLELAFKYNLSDFVENTKSAEPLINKLNKNVFFFETGEERYCLHGEKPDLNEEHNIFSETKTFSLLRVENPFEKNNDWYFDCAEPLSPDYNRTLLTGINWEEIVWSGSSVKLKNQEIEGLLCYKFYPIFEERVHFERMEN